MTDTTVPVTQELLPCPFCGSDETSHGFVQANIVMGNCECHTCNACIWAETEAEAIAAWNTRIAHQPTPVEGVEAMVERMAEIIRDTSCCGYTEADGSRSYCSRKKANPKSCECFDSARALLPILTQARAAARREGMQEAARIAAFSENGDQ